MSGFVDSARSGVYATQYDSVKETGSVVTFSSRKKGIEKRSKQVGGASHKRLYMGVRNEICITAGAAVIISAFSKGRAARLPCLIYV